MAGLGVGVSIEASPVLRKERYRSFASKRNPIAAEVQVVELRTEIDPLFG